MDRQNWIGQYQTHLVTAMIARIRATEAVIGPGFAFEIQQRPPMTLIAAHNWPHGPHVVPINRLYAYQPEHHGADDLLAYCITHDIDVIVEAELLPQLQFESLHTKRFAPRWTIAWLHVDLAVVRSWIAPAITIRSVQRAEMEHFASLVVDCYDYDAATAKAWHPFAEYGLTAPGFECFLAEAGNTPVGFGVLHSNGMTALVDGAATVPQYRNMGVQKALLHARLARAREQGCRYAFSRTGAGSISQHNLEKLGFSVAYQTVAWRRTMD